MVQQAMCPICKRANIEVNTVDHLEQNVKYYKMIWDCPECGIFEDYVINYKRERKKEIKWEKEQKRVRK